LLGTIAGGLDLAGEIAERQQLVSRPADLGLPFPRQIAAGRRGQAFGAVLRARRQRLKTSPRPLRLALARIAT
jgi:hypothetical protein